MKASSTMVDVKGYMKPRAVRKVIRATTNKRDEMLLKTLWTTGARISEVVGEFGITPNDMIIEENVLVMRTLKKHKRNRDPNIPPPPPPERRVTIPNWFMAELCEFCANTPSESRMFPISRQRAFQIVREAGKRAGVDTVGKKRIHPHHFRHSHCVAYIKSNNTLEGLRKLQQRLQHSNISATAHYLQFGTDRQEQQRIDETYTNPL